MTTQAAEDGIIMYEAPTAILFSGDGVIKAPSPSKRTKPSGQSRELMDTVIIPRNFEKKGTNFIQRASLVPAGRPDIIGIQKKLDTLLKQKEARETGLCPIRSDLYSQAFDEIIRQCTLTNTEQGLLMLRLRNEIRMSIAAYQTAYESAVAFGIRTGLTAEMHRRRLSEEIASIQEEVSKLKIEFEQTKARCEKIQTDAAATRADDLAKHTEEVEEMMKVQDARMRDLEEHLAPKKK